MLRLCTLLVGFALIGSPAMAAHGGPHVVSVRNNEFGPQRTEIDLDASVSWFAEDGGHTVTFDDGSLDVSLNAGQSTQRTFAERGVFTYHCRVHGSPRSGMWGSVVVGPALQVADVAVAEGNIGTSDAVVAVTMSRPVTHTVQVAFATADGTAIAGIDYESASGVVTFAAGATAAAIRVPIIGDTVREPTTSFTVTLSSPIGAAVERATATVRIVNDDDTVRTTPSDDYPTLADALGAIQPDTTVHVLPGLPALTQPVTVDVDRIVITGDGPASLIAPAANVESALRVRADHVTVEKVAIKHFSTAGVDVRDVRGFTLRDATLDTNRVYGLLLVGATDVSVRDVRVIRGDRAAIAIHECGQCDVDVRGVTAELAWAGVEVFGGSGVIVRDSSFRRNANGIVLRAAPGASRMIQSGAHVINNVIEDSGHADASGPRSLQARLQTGQLTRGAGVWIDGGRANRIESNSFDRNRFGVAVTGVSGPTLGAEIERNAFAESTTWDVGWDGAGSDVCVSENTTTSPKLVTQPPEAQTLYPCERRPTVGIAWPVVTAQLLA